MMSAEILLRSRRPVNGREKKKLFKASRIVCVLIILKIHIKIIILTTTIIIFSYHYCSGQTSTSRSAIECMKLTIY